LLPSFLIPQLKTALPGLRFNPQGEAELIPQLFTCCEGGGFHYHRQQRAYSRCPLVGRLQRVNRLCQQFKRLWGRNLGDKKPLPGATSTQFLPWLLKFREEQLPKGRLFSSATDFDEPSYGLWIMALMTIWRTGLDVHVVSLGKSTDGELLPPSNFATDALGILFVEQKGPFWQPRVAFDFDVIINWCEGAALPLWVDIALEHGKADLPREDHDEPLVLEKAFTKKLAKAKQRPPLAWLGDECCSRLRHLCVDGEQFM
jgi:hypothetical protein